MKDGEVVRGSGLHPLSEPSRVQDPMSATPPMLHGDLIGCATDLVLCRETSLTEVGKDGWNTERVLSDVRAAAAAYLIAAFAHATRPSDD